MATQNLPTIEDQRAQNLPAIGDQRAQDRAAITAPFKQATSAVARVALPAIDLATLPIRAGMGAVNLVSRAATAFLPPEMAIPQIPESVTGGARLTPYWDRYQQAYGAPSATPVQGTQPTPAVGAPQETPWQAPQAARPVQTAQMPTLAPQAAPRAPQAAPRAPQAAPRAPQAAPRAPQAAPPVQIDQVPTPAASTVDEQRKGLENVTVPVAQVIRGTQGGYETADGLGTIVFQTPKGGFSYIDPYALNNREHEYTKQRLESAGLVSVANAKAAGDIAQQRVASGAMERIEGSKADAIGKQGQVVNEEVLIDPKQPWKGTRKIPVGFVQMGEDKQPKLTRFDDPAPKVAAKVGDTYNAPDGAYNLPGNRKAIVKNKKVTEIK